MAPTEPPAVDAALEARLKGDLALQALLGDMERVEATAATIKAERDRLAEAVRTKAEQPPAKEVFDASPFGRIFGTTNPEYTAWQQKQDQADRVIAEYFEGRFEGFDEGTPTARYKELQATEKQLQATTSSLQRQISARTQEVQDAYTKSQQPGAGTSPSVVNTPTEEGGTEPRIWDPNLVNPDGTKGGFKPAPGLAPTPGKDLKQGTVDWKLQQTKDGRWFYVPYKADGKGGWLADTSQQPKPADALNGLPDLQMVDGVPHTRDPKTGNLLPMEGFSKPPLTTTDERSGQKYYSTDGGRTWKPAEGLPGRPQTLTSDGYVYPLDENGMPLPDRAVALNQRERTEVVDGFLVRYDPNTRAVERTDLYTPEQRARVERTAELGLETAQTNLARTQAELERARALQDPVAEYQRQAQAQQQKATAYRDQLNQRVLEGQLSVEDATSQFDTWWDSNVEAALTPYRTMAEASYRKEQNEYMRAQAAEQARVDAINRQREQVGHAAGEKARADLMALAPQGRSPEFLNQLAQNVSRIGEPLPGGVTQHHGGMRFSPESLSLDAVKRSQPSITEVGNAAVARALSQISPAAAQSVGAPPPQVPSLPQFQDFMGRAPFSIPNPALPVPGQEALDLGNPANAGRLGLPVQPGYAGTRYQGGRVEPWQIPAA